MASNPLIRVDEEVKKVLEQKKRDVEQRLGINEPSFNDVLRIELFGEEWEEKRRAKKVFNL